MTRELQRLVWSVLPGLAHVMEAAALARRQRGLRWNVDNRGRGAATLNGSAARAARASANFLETFPSSAVAVLAGML